MRLDKGAQGFDGHESEKPDYVFYTALNHCLTQSGVF